MKSILTKFVALAACLHLIGGHWIALQMVAWVGMFNDHQKEGSIVGAIEKTFDTQHPCPLCLAIQKGQEEEKKDEVSPRFEVVAVLPSELRLLTPAVRDIVYHKWAPDPWSLHLPQVSPPPEIS